MTNELVVREIDGKSYEFQQFGAKLALKTLIRLQRIIGQPLVMAMTSLGITKATTLNKVMDNEIDAELLAKAAASLSDRMGEDETVQLIELLTAEKCLCDGKKVLFDSHYAGQLGHLSKVIQAALEVQYGDFFGALLGRLS